jgi:hypothetical protein
MRKNSEVSFFLLTNAKKRNELFGKYRRFDIASPARHIGNGILHRQELFLLVLYGLLLLDSIFAKLTTGNRKACGSA